MSFFARQHDRHGKPWPVCSKVGEESVWQSLQCTILHHPKCLIVQRTSGFYNLLMATSPSIDGCIVKAMYGFQRFTLW